MTAVVYVEEISFLLRRFLLSKAIVDLPPQMVFAIILTGMAIIFGAVLTLMMCTIGLPITSTVAIVLLSSIIIPIALMVFAFPFMGSIAFIPVGVLCVGTILFAGSFMFTIPGWYAILIFATLCCMFGIPLLSIPIVGQVGIAIIACFFLATLMTLFV